MFSKNVVICFLLAMVYTVRAERLQTFSNKTEVDEDDVESAANCAICKVVVDTVKSYVKSGEIIRYEKEAIEKICHHLPLLRNQCARALQHVLDYLLNQLEDISSELVCEKLRFCP
ncbi:hypothetical protein FGIG_08280 [Fasciola gigantica]|uniref:Saposin B-type domain-containing protein n=1 Tax=Fasciola gigantica TaxID=46835 RepID=A0A504YPL1_FASGI|nr:hypothetical protein FGIG_08280 [Fasciola gigantica]